jgi:hypothetical protein
MNIHEEKQYFDLIKILTKKVQKKQEEMETHFLILET